MHKSKQNGYSQYPGTKRPNIRGPEGPCHGVLTFFASPLHNLLHPHLTRCKYATLPLRTAPQRHAWLDCPSGYHLCYLCSIEVAGGLSRWSWEACDGCRKKNDRERQEGRAFYFLGRHSVMNGIALPMSEVRERKVNAGVRQMLDFIRSLEGLRLAALARTEAMWRSAERWNALSEIPVLDWRNEFLERPTPSKVI
jgi:hypothetical protein